MKFYGSVEAKDQFGVVGQFGFVGYEFVVVLLWNPKSVVVVVVSYGLVGFYVAMKPKSVVLYCCKAQIGGCIVVKPRSAVVLCFCEAQIVGGGGWSPQWSLK